MIIAMSVLVRPEGLILCLVSFGKVKHIYTNKFLLLAMPASGMSIGVYRALPSRLASSPKTGFEGRGCWWVVGQGTNGKPESLTPTCNLKPYWGRRSHPDASPVHLWVNPKARWPAELEDVAESNFAP
jgi:hypothetical protein